MRYFLIISIIILSASCKENCSNIQCEACSPFESSRTVIFEFDSARFDSFLLYNDQSGTDTTYTVYSLQASKYQISYDHFNYYKRIGTRDKSRIWRIGEAKLYKTKGEDCCDCGTETITELTINDTPYTRAQLPLLIK